MGMFPGSEMPIGLPAACFGDHQAVSHSASSPCGSGFATPGGSISAEESLPPSPVLRACGPALSHSAHRHKNAWRTELLAQAEARDRQVKGVIELFGQYDYLRMQALKDPNSGNY